MGNYFGYSEFNLTITSKVFIKWNLMIRTLSKSNELAWRYYLKKRINY